MINVIKDKIKNYYSQCGYNDYIDFSKELIIFYYVIADDNFIEIRSDINKYKVITYYNDTKINEITFFDIKSYYFYFIKNINKKYFIKNISFYTNGEFDITGIVTKDIPEIRKVTKESKQLENSF